MVPRERKKLKNWTTAEIHATLLNVALKGETKIPLITSELNTMKYNRKSDINHS